VDFSLNPQLSVSKGYVGTGREPIIVIDNVLRNPNDMLEFSTSKVTFNQAWSSSGGYPGVRAHAPQSYTSNMVYALTPIIEEVFELRDVEPVRADCYLSLITRDPDKLAPLQRIPHIDTVDPLRIALLHYFCDESFGGTAFYKHRGTGLETISAGQEPEYLRTRDREMTDGAPGKGYLREGNVNYEQLDVVQSCFNRLVVYRSCLLHCGVIPEDMNRSADPRTGRLTANVFISYENKQQGGN